MKQIAVHSLFALAILATSVLSTSCSNGFMASGPRENEEGDRLYRPVNGTWAGHWSIRTTSSPAWVKFAAMLLPFAPVPRTAIFLLIRPPVPGVQSPDAPFGVHSRQIDGKSHRIVNAKSARPA